jgi:hypothetical protein
VRRSKAIIHDLDPARLDDVETEIPVAGFEERLSVLVSLEHCQGIAPQRGQLALIELGEGDGIQIVLGHVSLTPGARPPHRKYSSNSSGTSISASSM